MTSNLPQSSISIVQACRCSVFSHPWRLTYAACGWKHQWNQMNSAILAWYGLVMCSSQHRNQKCKSTSRWEGLSGRKLIGAFWCFHIYNLLKTTVGSSVGWQGWTKELLETTKQKMHHIYLLYISISSILRWLDGKHVPPHEIKFTVSPCPGGRRKGKDAIQMGNNMINIDTLW